MASPATAASNDDEGNEPAGAAFTCRFTAALRHVETTLVPNPVLSDPLAPLLCGPRALKLAQDELAGLAAAQGPGKHLRVPARTRLVEEQLLDALRQLSSHEQGGVDVQVVSLGCGMDTRPWRLPQLAQRSGCRVRWFDVDQPEIARLKLDSLAAAGAQTSAEEVVRPGDGQRERPAAAAFPLHCSSYAMVGADLSVVPLREALVQLAEPAQPFRADLPTVWVLEAVIYYLPLEAADALLQAMAELSAPGSRAVLTCVDADLLEASRSRMHATHIFANLWHFDVDEMCACRAYRRHWETRVAPRSTKDLALELLGADTYVALYGGAECLLVADLKPPPPEQQPPHEPT